VPDSSSRTAARFVWGLLQAGVYLVLAAAVLFVALTRTEVGRDRLRRELQSAFNEQFVGELEIGRLQGTLLNEVRASHLRLRDDSGRVVATIDSVAGTPSWKQLFAAELSVQSLTVIGPHLTLHRRADGTWNAAHALRRAAPAGDGPGALFDVALLDISVRDGRVTTTREGDAPAPVRDRWLFDFTQSTIDQLQLDGSIRWTDARRMVDLEALSFRLPAQDLALQSAEASLTRRGDRWAVDPVSVQLGNTQLRARGTVHLPPDSAAAPAVEMALAESRLDYDQLRRLVPRLPLRNVVAVEGRMGGTVDRFVINRLAVTHGRSRLAVEGTAFGLPDSLNLDAQLLESRLRPDDVRSVWPGAPLDRIEAVGPVTLSASLRGLVEWRNRPRPAFDLKGSLTAAGRPGAVQGTLAVARSAAGPLRYDGSVEADSLNLAPLSGTPRLDSRLTGRAQVEGSGTSFDTFNGTVAARLTNSRVGPRRLARADLRLSAAQRVVEAEGVLQQPAGGSLSLSGSVDAQSPSPFYDLTATARRFDLAGAHPALPSSQLNASLSVDGRGGAWNTLAGSATLSVAASQLGPADSTRTLPAHEASLILADPASSAPRLTLDGTIASATIEGPPLHPALRTTARHWRRALGTALRQEWAAAARPQDSPQTTTDSLSLPSDLPALDAPLHLEAALSVHRMDLLKRWWPAAPDQSDRLRATSRLTLGPDTLSTAGTVRAAHLRLGTRRVDSLDASFQLSAAREPDLLGSLTTALAARADTVQIGPRSLVAPSTRLTLMEGTGTLEARAEGLGRTGPFRLQSDVRLDRGLALRITDLYAGADEYAWQTQRPGHVTLFPNAVVVDSLALRSPRSRVPTDQRLLLHGTLSDAATDTLHAEMSDVLLYPIGEMASLPRPLGGRLNGMVAVTGGWTQPQVRSAFTVHRLTFDRRVLGNLRVQTRLRPDTPDLQLDASLRPSADSVKALDGPALVPGGPRRIEASRLNVAGRVRLPGLAAADTLASDPLDLRVQVDRADLFFFEYIFEETLTQVRGYTAGTLHIGGRFRKPHFDAQMEVREGRFRLPKFGLAYGISGPVDVDRRGIHLGQVSVTDDGGSATITGSVLFNDYRYFSFDLSGELDEISVIDVEDAQDLPFYGTIRASGPASLTGPLQDATLRSSGARTTPDSELFIPVSEGEVEDGSGFIVFADSTGQVPNLRDLTRRDNILSDRPAGEPTFLDGLEIDINVLAPEESTVNLVFDPIVGDVVTAVGSGRVQLQRQEGEFFVYGDFNVSGGTYLFTAGEVFVRRFNINEGTITWDGPPTNALLDLKADYRTRASPAGLPGYDDESGRIPVRVMLDIGGRVETPRVDLSLALVRDERNSLVGSQTLDAILNQSDRTTEYATSVLLTNTFLLTTESFTGPSGSGTGNGGTSGNLNTAGRKLAFNSVSQLVASQLNRYLGAALPNVDLNFGVQGENPSDLDLIYGVALRLLNERLVIRGEGVYTGDDPDSREAQGPQGEFVVEVRLSQRVSVEAFYRRSGDELTQGQTLTSSTGAGLSYQTEFSTWRELWHRLFGWLVSDDEPEAPPSPPPAPPSDSTTTAPVVRRDAPASPSSP
jgi:hypothetical protein